MTNNDIKSKSDTLNAHKEIDNSLIDLKYAKIGDVQMYPDVYNEDREIFIQVIDSRTTKNIN